MVFRATVIASQLLASTASQSAEATAALQVSQRMSEVLATTNTLSMVQNMENTLHSTLKTMVTNATKKPATNDGVMANITNVATFLKEWSDQIDLLASSVKTEATAGEATLRTAHERVTSCNVAATTDLDDILAVTKVEQDTKADAHKNCRKQQSGLEDTQGTKCGDAADYAVEVKDEVPACLSSLDANMTHTLWCMGEANSWYNDHQPIQAAKNGDCTSAQDDAASKLAGCDSLQDEYEKAFSCYHCRLDAVCSTLTTCHENAVKHHEALKEDVKVMVDSQTTLWKGIQKVKCFLEKFTLAQSQFLTHDDLKSCTDATTFKAAYDDTEGAQLQNYTKHNDADPKSTCTLDPQTLLKTYGVMPFTNWNIAGKAGNVCPGSVSVSGNSLSCGNPQRL